MGLFDKKYCDLCGAKIGLLGNRKLEDGNCCKVCAGKLSHWFDERRHSTVAQIKEQLAYREANKASVASFHTTKTYGESTLLHIDEAAGRFMVVRTRSIAEENPDVLDISQVTGVNVDVKESKTELKQEDSQGNKVSYSPPRYEYDYDFYIIIRVDHPWFDEMRFKLNRNDVIVQDMGTVRPTVRVLDPRRSVEYQNYAAMGQEIVTALTSRSASPGEETVEDLKNRAIDLYGAGRKDEAETLIRRIADTGDPEYTQRYVAILQGRAAKASLDGNREAAAALYKEMVARDPSRYTELLDYLEHNVTMAGMNVTEAEARELLDCANAAKAAGHPADHYIETAETCLRYRQAASPEAAASAFMLAQQQAMAAAMAQKGQAPAQPQQAQWTCVCGAPNTGKFCEYCGSPRP